MASPGLIGLVVLWPLEEWWEWLLAIFAVYVVLVGAVAKEQVWKPSENTKGAS
jgi:hypothetical protein